MNNKTSSETPFQREKRIFSELMGRLIDAIVQSVFDLRPKRAAQRFQYLIFLFVLSGFLVTLLQEKYALAIWAGHIQNVFLYLFNKDIAAQYAGAPDNPITLFIKFVLEAFTNPHTVQYLPIFLAPFFIALQAAAMYLKDIFELEDVSVARSFIWEVALSGSDQVIQIKHGEIADEHSKSPNYLIGGPGKVIVDLDTVALFERSDGTTHIIGPTGKNPGGKAVIDGFERFREAVDLRDHFIELRDQDLKSQSVKSRSLDGIPVSATDVNLLFSVHRDGQQPTDSNPYPFSEASIQKFVYTATSKVTPGSPNPSTFVFDWKSNMVGLIRGKLGGFMSERPLTMYLASIGMPEYEKAKEREKIIAEEAKQIIPPTEAQPEVKGVKQPPEFTPRSKVANLFSQFAKDFIEVARQSGVQLHWMSVGTWKTPIEKVFEKHLEAWQISHENIKNGSPEVLEKLQREAELTKTISLIQTLPIYAYEQLSTQYPEREDAIQALLLEYQRLLKDQMELMQKIGLSVNPSLVAAIFYIDRRIAHKLYPAPPKQSSEEKKLYGYLLRQMGTPGAIEKLVDMVKEAHPNSTRLEQLTRIADAWDADMDLKGQPRDLGPDDWDYDNEYEEGYPVDQ